MYPIKNEELKIKYEELLLHSSSFVPKTVLTIAGHDPTAGAGITSDLKTFQNFGVYGVSVVTAVTVQNTRGVFSTNPVEASVVEAQLNALARDIKIGAVKIGMLAIPDTVSCVASFIAEQFVPTVLDPVCASSNGVRFMDKRAISTLERELLPLVDILTPNIHEASVLAGITIDSKEQVVIAAEKLHRMGAKNVLIKGGHSNDWEFSSDLLFDGINFEWLSAPRLPKHVHGTGCLLSASIASLLAKGLTMRESVIGAKSFVTQMLECAIALGSGRDLFQHEYIEPSEGEIPPTIIS